MELNNQPYHDLEDLPFIGAFIAATRRALEATTGGVIPFDFLHLIKSNYINSGTSGWWEKTVWAVDVGDVSHGTGQAKLVNWAENTRLDMPNEMDWELPHLNREEANSTAEQIDQLNASIESSVQDFIGMLRRAGSVLPIPVAAGGLESLVRFNDSPAVLVEINADASEQGVIENIVALVGSALNSLATLCKDSSEMIINLNIELPKGYAKSLEYALNMSQRKSDNRFGHALGVMAASQMLTKAQFKDSARTTGDLDNTIDDTLTTTLFTLYWMFNGSNSASKKPLYDVNLKAGWKLQEKNKLNAKMIFKKDRL